MGVVSFLQKRKLTHRVFTSFREFLVDSRAVGIILIAYTIFSLTHSFLPAAPSVLNSFSQHLLMVNIGIFALVVLGKLLVTWFRQMTPAHVVGAIVCKEITKSRRIEKI